MLLSIVEFITNAFFQQEGFGTSLFIYLFLDVAVDLVKHSWYTCDKCRFKARNIFFDQLCGITAIETTPHSPNHR